MRNLLFVAASTSHASWLCRAFECTSCDPLGRTLIVCKDRIWGYWQLPVLVILSVHGHCIGHGRLAVST